MTKNSDIPTIPNVEDLELLPKPEAPYVVKHQGNRWESARYRGKWKLGLEEGNSTTIPVIVEVIPLGDGTRWETPDNPKKRADVLEELTERIKTLASRPMPYVVPVLAAGELENGDYYAVRPETDAVVVDDHKGLNEPKDFSPLVERLYSGLAALHDTGITFGDLRLDDLRSPKDDKSSLCLSGVEFGALPTITGGYIKRQGSLNGSNPQQPGEDTGDDVHRLAQLICQLVGGRNNESPDKIQDASLRKLVERCLSDDNSRRRGNARDALNQLGNDRKGSRLSRSWPHVAAALLALALIAVATLWWRDNDAKTNEIKSKDDQITSLGRDKQDLFTANERLKNYLKRPHEPPPANGVPAFSDEEATRLFHRYYGKDERPELEIDKWIEAEREDNPEVVTKATSKINGYRYALDKGDEYGLKLTEAVNRNKKSELRSPNLKDKQTWRITVYVDGSEVGRFEYPLGESDEPLKFKWRPKQKIRLLVEDFWTWTWPNRDNLIDVTYGGEYALWQLHHALQELVDKDTTIKGEITNFPKDGPKREYVKPLPTLPPSKAAPAEPSSTPVSQ